MVSGDLADSIPCRAVAFDAEVAPLGSDGGADDAIDGAADGHGVDAGVDFLDSEFQTRIGGCCGRYRLSDGSSDGIAKDRVILFRRRRRGACGDRFGGCANTPNRQHAPPCSSGAKARVESRIKRVELKLSDIIGGAETMPSAR